MKSTESNLELTRALRSALPRLLVLLFGAMLVLTWPGNAFSQGGNRGAISGTVRDEKGASVPGAQIEIINAGTGITERSATSDGSGNFTVTQLPAGDYKLVVSAAGFSKADVPDVKVNVTETTTVNVPLKVGDVNASVTVTGAATDLQLTSPATGQTLSDETIGNLPL